MSATSDSVARFARGAGSAYNRAAGSRRLRRALARLARRKVRESLRKPD